jgi:hypothetical protein
VLQFCAIPQLAREPYQSIPPHVQRFQVLQLSNLGREMIDILATKVKNLSF